MTYYDTQQQNPAHNSPFNPQQWAAFSSQAAQPYGAWPSAPSMQAIGGYGLGQAPYGQQYGQYGGQPSTGAFGYNAAWGAQPQGWGQQQQPQWGGQQQRQLSQQDVSEVVRQIVGMLQNQPQLQYAAMQGGQGFGQQGFGQQGLGQYGLGQFGQGNPLQNLGAQFGGPQYQSAFGAPAAWGQQQRQLTQQDVADITRQLIGVIPQVIGNLQAFNQQRMI